jgi:hypothetical protein
VTQDEAITTVLACRTVSLDVAAASIPMGRNKAHRLARTRGELLEGVPVIRKGDHGYVVPTPALRRKLQLQDFTTGTTPPAAVPPVVENGGGEATDDLASRRSNRRPPATTSPPGHPEEGERGGQQHSTTGPRPA